MEKVIQNGRPVGYQKIPIKFLVAYIAYYFLPFKENPEVSPISYGKILLAFHCKVFHKSQRKRLAVSRRQLPALPRLKCGNGYAMRSMRSAYADL